MERVLFRLSDKPRGARSRERNFDALPTAAEVKMRAARFFRPAHSMAER